MSGIQANNSGAAADRFDAFWDDLVQTGSADLSAATNSDAARLSLISYAGLLVPRSDPAARERIRRRVFADYPERAMQTALNVRTASDSAGRVPIALPLSLPAPSMPHPWRRRSIGMLELAIAAVLVLATIGGIALLSPNNEPEQLPAVVGSPNSAFGTPDVSEQVATGEMLLRLDLGGRLNYTRLSVTITRVTLEPGARWTFAPDDFPVVNHPIDQYVESGTLTVGIGGTEYTVRSGRGPDFNGAPDYLSNTTSDPVVMLLAIAFQTDGTPPYPFTGAMIEHIGTAAIPPFSGDIERIVTVVRVRTVDGPALLADPGQRPIFVAVESGAMRIQTAPDAEVTTSSIGLAIDWPPGLPTVVGHALAEGVELGPGETLAVDDAYGITETEIDGDEELVTVSLNVRVLSTSEAAVGEVNQNTVNLEIAPDDGRVSLRLYKIALASDATLNQPVDGAAIVRIIEGQVAVTQNAGDVPHQLEPDDSFALPGPGSLVVETIGDGPAVLIVGLVLPIGDENPFHAIGLESNFVLTPLGGSEVELPPGDAQLQLWTDPISPDPANSLVAFQTNGANLVSVLAGSVDVVRYGGQVSVFDGPFTVDDEPASEGQEYPFGVKATASSGDAVVAQPRSAYSLSTHGDEAPLVATLSIDSETPIDMTTPGPRGDEPITYGPESCQVDPRPADDLRRLIENPDASRIDPGLRDEASAGEAADAATAADITDNVRASLACSMFGTPLQGYALFTDNAILAGAVANGLTLAEIDEMELATAEVHPEDYVGTFSIDEISLFPDGRAGAWIFTQGELAFLTLVHDPETGRWLIDAWDDRERGESAAAIPEA